jgi:hypothetical protein
MNINGHELNGLGDGLFMLQRLVAQMGRQNRHNHPSLLVLIRVNSRFNGMVAVFSPRLLHPSLLHLHPRTRRAAPKRRSPAAFSRTGS